MQIYMPLETGRWTYAEVRAFVGTCGRLIGRADPDRVTMAWRIADRTGKTFIDHNMNRQGANIAAAYSLRPEPRAPVSTPLTWDEVEAGGFEPQDFRIDNVWERFSRVGDLWAPVPRGPAQDLSEAMEALDVQVEDDPSGPLPRTAARRSRPRRPTRSRRVARTPRCSSTSAAASSARRAPPSLRRATTAARGTPS